MSEVLVVGSESFTGNYATVSAAIVGIGGATLIITADNTFAGGFARQWAVTNGIPFIHLGSILSGNGYDTFQAPLTALYFSTPTHTLTCGSHARITAASGQAVVKGKTLVQI